MREEVQKNERNQVQPPGGEADTDGAGREGGHHPGDDQHDRAGQDAQPQAADADRDGAGVHAGRAGGRLRGVRKR